LQAVSCHEHFSKDAIFIHVFFTYAHIKNATLTVKNTTTYFSYFLKPDSFSYHKAGAITMTLCDDTFMNDEYK